MPPIPKIVYLHRAMRRIGQAILNYDEQHRRLRPPHGTVAFGSSHFDPFLYAEGLREFLSGLRKGKTPEQACEEAKTYAREVVGKWNSNGSKACVSIRGSYELHRDKASADAIIEDAMRFVIQATA